MKQKKGVITSRVCRKDDGLKRRMGLSLIWTVQRWHGRTISGTAVVLTDMSTVFSAGSGCRAAASFDKAPVLLGFTGFPQLFHSKYLGSAAVFPHISISPGSKCLEHNREWRVTFSSSITFPSFTFPPRRINLFHLATTAVSFFGHFTHLMSFIHGFFNILQFRSVWITLCSFTYKNHCRICRNKTTKWKLFSVCIAKMTAGILVYSACTVTCT